MTPDVLHVVGDICQIIISIILVILVFKLGKEIRFLLTFKEEIFLQSIVEKEKWERLNKMFLDKGEEIDDDRVKPSDNS